MDSIIDKLLAILFGLAITIAIGILLYHWLPNTAQGWIQTQINTIFNMGNNLIGGATGGLSQ